MISKSMAYDSRHVNDTWQCQLCEDILHTWHTTSSWSENMFEYVCCVCIVCMRGRCDRQNAAKKSWYWPSFSISISANCKKSILIGNIWWGWLTLLTIGADMTLNNRRPWNLNIRRHWENLFAANVLDPSWTLPKVFDRCVLLHKKRRFYAKNR